MQITTLSKFRIFGVIVFSFLLLNLGFAQTAEESPKNRRFFTGLSFGLGNAGSTHYNRNDIMKRGFSNLMPSREFVLELGYMVTDKLHIATGWTAQILQLQFDYDGEDHRFTGSRHVLPLTFRRFLGDDDSDIKLIMIGGGYYALRGRDISQAPNKLEDPFNNIGVQAGFGISYMRDNTEVYATYTASADLLGDVVRVNHARFAFGFRTYVF